MIQIQLPNLRLLGLPSVGQGEDWLKKSQILDQELEQLNYDLEGESVYLLFSRSPEDVLEQGGQCLVARAVIGAQKEVPEPFILRDLESQMVWKADLKGTSVVEVLEEVEEAWTKASFKGKILKEEFILRIRRRIAPTLELSLEVIFLE